MIDTVRAFDGFESSVLAEDANVFEDAFVSLSGWAIDTATMVPAGAATLIVDGSAERSARYGIARPDVARYFDLESLAASGFSVSIPASVLGAGRHEIAVRITDRRGTAHVDLPARSICVVEGSSSVRPRLPDGRLAITIEPPGDEVDRERIEDAATLWRYRVAVVRGVARDTVAGAACSDVRLVLDDELIIDTIVGYPSGANGEERCGFKATFLTDELEVGDHTLRAVASTTDGTGYASSDELRFALRPFGGKSEPQALIASGEPRVEWEAFASRATTNGGLVRVRRGETVYFRGWALDASGAAAPAAFLLLDGSHVIDATNGQERPDLVERFSSERTRFAGFVARCSTAKLAAGSHRIRIVTVADAFSSLSESDERVAFEIAGEANHE